MRNPAATLADTESTTELSDDDPTSDNAVSLWWVYLVQCADGTFYTGITTNPQRRLRQHNGELAGGARYTRSRRPVVLAYQEPCRDRSHASQREAAVRKLSRSHKQTLATRPVAF